MPSLNQTTVHDQNWRRGNVFLYSGKEIRIHYIDSPSSAAQKGTILLIHGFPQTSYQWRHVITPLSDAGYRVIAPDYRGAGDSSRPKAGFDKLTVAEDLFRVVHDHLGVKDSIHVIGQDIGGMVAHAYASLHPSHVRSIMWGECPLPGSTPYETFQHSPGMWHFTFHAQADLPELLTQGREKIYIKTFYDRLCYNPAGIGKADVDFYAAVFEQPGSMRCGFGLYRAFPQDAKDNQARLKEGGKLKMPAAAFDGDNSLLLEVAEEQTREFYENVEIVTVEGSGHWMAEENPVDFVKKALAFVGKH